MPLVVIPMAAVVEKDNLQRIVHDKSYQKVSASAVSSPVKQANPINQAGFPLASIRRFRPPNRQAVIGNVFVGSPWVYTS